MCKLSDKTKETLIECVTMAIRIYKVKHGSHKPSLHIFINDKIHNLYSALRQVSPGHKMVIDYFKERE